MLNKGHCLSRNHSTQNDFWFYWSEYNERVLRCCSKWLRNDLDKVEDAIAQTREKAYKAFAREVDKIENMFAWLCRIAHNICMDIHRFHAKQFELVNQVSSAPCQFYFADNVSLSLEKDYEIQRLHRSLLSAIEGLSPDLKQIIQYKFIYDLEYDEIATQLKLSQENVRKRVSLARKQLAKLKAELEV